MGKPEFTLLRLLDIPSKTDEYGYILKESIESNPKNLKLNIQYQTLKVKSTESISVHHGNLNRKQVLGLKRDNKFVLDKTEGNFDKKIKAIEANLPFEIISKSKAFGSIKLNGHIDFISNMEVEGKTNFEIFLYSYETESVGVYEGTIAFQLDIMIDDFYGQAFPNYIGLQSEFMEISKFVKPEFNAYFEEHYIKNFQEGKTIFLWDY